MKTLFFLLLTLFLFSKNAVCQSNKPPLDSLRKAVRNSKLDTLGQQERDKPMRAALLSGIFPAGGQMYNKGSLWYVKVPVIWAGFAYFAYTVQANNNEFVGARNELLYRLDPNPLTVPDPKYSRYDNDGLLNQRDRFERDRDYNAILMAGFYALTILEAAATAHLKKFDVSNDLSFRIKPSFAPMANTAGMYAVGIGLQFSFEKNKKNY
ncbi:MAG: hypothetical protein EAZ97_03775 [Bacteroidetes bacterium]|nr:MAG: hypothetical protein EAZ97_03775 [Bacteroidota bacterium]